MFGAFFPKRGCSLLCLCDSVPGLCRFLTVRPVHRGVPTFTKTGLVLFRVSEECVQTSCLCSIMTHNLLNVLTWWHAYGEGRNNSSVLFFKVCPGFLGYVWRQLHQDCASDVAEWCRCGENEGAASVFQSVRFVPTTSFWSLGSPPEGCWDLDLYQPTRLCSEHGKDGTVRIRVSPPDMASWEAYGNGLQFCSLQSVKNLNVWSLRTSQSILEYHRSYRNKASPNLM